MKQQKLIFDKKGEFAINFTWDTLHRLYFSGIEVCSDYTDEENPKFITFDTGSGINSDCTDFKDVSLADIFFEGFIRWDGTMVIQNLNYEFYYKSDILQRVTDLIYESAKEIMGDRCEF